MKSAQSARGVVRVQRLPVLPVEQGVLHGCLAGLLHACGPGSTALQQLSNGRTGVLALLIVWLRAGAGAADVCVEPGLERCNTAVSACI